MQHAIQGDEPNVLTDIYLENINIAIWQRKLSSTLTHSIADFLRIKPRFNTSMNVSAQSVLASISESLGEEIVSAADMDGFYGQLEALMVETEFLNPDDPRYLMRRMRRLYGRIDVTRSELNLLRGSLSAFKGRKSERRKTEND